MAGRKSITLLNGRGKPIDRNYRYKSLKSAVRKATALCIGLHRTIQIWHLEAGKELAHLQQTRGKVTITIPRSTVFFLYWDK